MASAREQVPRRLKPIACIRINNDVSLPYGTREMALWCQFKYLALERVTRMLLHAMLS